MPLVLKYSKKYDDYEVYKRKINLICIVSLVIAFMTFVAMPSAHAAFWNNMAIASLVDLIQFTLTAPMYVIYSVLTGKDATNLPTNDGLNTLYASIVGTEENNFMMDIGNSFYSGYSTTINIIKIAASFMIIIIAAARLLSNVEKGMDGSQATFKAMIEIGMTGLFIAYLDKIMGYLSFIGTGLFESVLVVPDGKAAAHIRHTARGIGILFARPTYARQLISYHNANSGLAFWECSRDVVGSIGFDKVLYKGCTIGNLIGGYIKVLPSIITSVAVFVGCGLAVIQTILEIMIRKIIAPIAVVDIYQEGLRSPGARFLKKYLAAFVKLLIIAIIAFSVPLIQATIAPTIFDHPMIYILLFTAICFSAVGMMFKGGELANEMLGV